MMKKIKKFIVCSLILGFILPSLSIYGQGIMEQTTLTGNWGGVRDTLAQNGVFLKPRTTLFYQGSTEDRFRFGGKADLQAAFNGAKIGLSQLTLSAQVEYVFGNSVNGSKVLFPVNTGLNYPGLHGNDRFDLSSLYLTYTPSQATAIMLGKINLVELGATTRFRGGAGIDGPMNIQFAATPDGLAPATMMGAAVVVKTKYPIFTFMAYDPNDQTNKSGFDDVFKDITFSVDITLPTMFGGQFGTQSLKGGYSTKGGVDLGNINISIQDKHLYKKDQRWMIGYGFTQNFVTYDAQGNGWGIYGQAVMTDGNPSPVKYDFIVGLGGNSFIKNRHQDNWGVGYFYSTLSDKIKGIYENLNTAFPIIPRVGDSQGVEVYYNYKVTQWLALTADFQWVKPGIKTYDDIFYGGVRMRVLL